MSIRPNANALEQRNSIRELLRRGAIVVELHNAECKPHTGSACLVVLADPTGALLYFSSQDTELIEPDVRCVCASLWR